MWIVSDFSGIIKNTGIGKTADGGSFFFAGRREDGYSGSDSLMRPDLFFDVSEGNSTYLLEPQNGMGENVTLTGTVSTFEGYFNETE